jgi:molybdopterin-guanine dinucleotide biosynthesis protein A
MLMIGAMGRNAGKTEFACSLIRKFCSEHNVIGIKVTPVDKADGTCPRGGTGCGVCTSLNGNYDITEETDSLPDKDTCRMLAAGAKKVFWLRSLRTHLTEAMATLQAVIGSDAVLVCESNSLRGVVEPGLFFIVKGRAGQKCKASAKKVIEHADRIISFDGEKFDIDPDEIELVDGRWAAKMEATAIIMAGGDSSRMGLDKSMLPIKSKPVIEHIFEQLRGHFNQILISSNDTAKHAFLGIEVVPDRIAGKGPLMGIASALKASVNEVNFVIACDIPEVDIAVVRMMVRGIDDFDVVMPRVGASKFEPLFSVYRKSILGVLENALSAGKTKIIDPLANCKVNYIDFSESQIQALANLNTMDDYRKYVVNLNIEGEQKWKTAT